MRRPRVAVRLALATGGVLAVVLDHLLHSAPAFCFARQEAEVAHLPGG